MQVLVNSDHRITGTEELSTQVRASVEDTLGHLADQITRVEVHLNDVNGLKGGPDDKRCMMEARIKGHDPVAVTDAADSLDLAIDGAVNKLHKALEHRLGRVGRA